MRWRSRASRSWKRAATAMRRSPTPCVRVGGTRPIPVDVRIISATHCDLDTRVREGRFRADLFYRLGVLRLTLPPLRDRSEDLVPLAEWCLKNALAALGARPHANLQAEVLACA